MVVSGGGVHNSTLMRLLSAELLPHGITVTSIAALGVSPEAKEALAFAVLACCTRDRLPGNIAAATGARAPAILGKLAIAPHSTRHATA